MKLTDEEINAESKRFAYSVENIDPYCNNLSEGGKLKVIEWGEKFHKRGALWARAHVNKWISVEDQLPEPNVDVLIYSEEGRISVERREKRNNFIYSDQTDSGCATYWMPLPDSPQFKIGSAMFSIGEQLKAPKE